MGFSGFDVGPAGYSGTRPICLSWLSRTPPAASAGSGFRKSCLGEVAPHPAQTVELLFHALGDHLLAQGMRGVIAAATATFLGLAQACP